MESPVGILAVDDHSPLSSAPVANGIIYPECALAFPLLFVNWLDARTSFFVMSAPQVHLVAGRDSRRCSLSSARAAPRPDRVTTAVCFDGPPARPGFFRIVDSAFDST